MRAVLWFWVTEKANYTAENAHKKIRQMKIGNDTFFRISRPYSRIMFLRAPLLH
jgi:hypothetical protein